MGVLSSWPWTWNNPFNDCVGRVIAVFNKLFKEHMETVAFDYVEE